MTTLEAELSLITPDLELLRAYEPVLRYNEGELFFPTAVEGYLAECDLLEGTSERDSVVVVPRGQVTTATLGTFLASADRSLYLRLVQQPLSGIELARWQGRPGRPHFRAPGRLARVGLFGRLVDAGFDASLLLRGTVPGGTAAAAQIKYEAARAEDPRLVYYGRVVRRNGWIVLHYLYFYFMNDYRSTFDGANDHEADWEQVFVYLEDRPDAPRPVWIAAAAHDYIGDQLRRRWDDPTLVKEGDHPVLFAGAGSHASYFEQGEYLTSVPIAAVNGLVNFMDVVRGFWVRTLRQPDPGDIASHLEDALSASFVDYARGDGLAVGPGHLSTWTPIEISDADDWVDGYRGLFGLDTHDRFGGERSPAGPKYNRNGTQRMTWHDPLGFGGLDKAPPPFRRPVVLRGREAELEVERVAVEASITERVARLQALSVEVESLAADGGMEHLRLARAAELAAGELELRDLRKQHAGLDDRLTATRRELRLAGDGDVGDPRAHLTTPHRPVPPEDTQHGLIVEIWSALSVSVLLIAVAALVWFQGLPWFGAIALGLAGYVVLESAFRRRLTQLILAITVLLAILGAIVLAWEFRVQVVVAAIVGLAFLILTDNLREVRRR
jgi:hypothetical protein